MSNKSQTVCEFSPDYHHIIFQLNNSVHIIFRVENHYIVDFIYSNSKPANPRSD